ncbi:hypothetical protein H310_00950 [Aphanomyces invadans]|uniref:Uncharacterized protein n=1 Tax=Aphanomyces invadans TaxID=157072 RepID=A0A024UR69_9STRA|nr:hypothetical protein H310_00950 [Aphanomyces invadans]ETW08352.1 hypothetical protein H310_00950 [Aphanomyces invadans]|eukprot:XP_008862157.1 hypothetical protein H310_00950 [Aphanomyces invadans]
MRHDSEEVEVAYCKFAGCSNASRSRGLCRNHGGSRCRRLDGWHNFILRKALCDNHGGFEYCIVPECNKIALQGCTCRTHTISPSVHQQSSSRSAVSFNWGRRMAVVPATHLTTLFVPSFELGSRRVLHAVYYVVFTLKLSKTCSELTQAHTQDFSTNPVAVSWN